MNERLLDAFLRSLARGASAKSLLQIWSQSVALGLALPIMGVTFVSSYRGTSWWGHAPSEIQPNSMAMKLIDAFFRGMARTETVMALAKLIHSAQSEESKIPLNVLCVVVWGAAAFVSYRRTSPILQGSAIKKARCLINTPRSIDAGLRGLSRGVSANALLQKLAKNAGLDFKSGGWVVLPLTTSIGAFTSYRLTPWWSTQVKASHLEVSEPVKVTDATLRGVARASTGLNVYLLITQLLGLGAIFDNPYLGVLGVCMMVGIFLFGGMASYARNQARLAYANVQVKEREVSARLLELPCVEECSDEFAIVG